MSDDIQNALEQVGEIWKATAEALSEWKDEGNLQFPTLLGILAVKMNWDDKQVREADPIVRFYIRRNTEYHVTRGAHGGIMRASDKQKKELTKSIKETVKKQLQSQLEAKVALLISASKNPIKTEIKDEFEEDIPSEIESEDDDIFSDR